MSAPWNRATDHPLTPRATRGARAVKVVVRVAAAPVTPTPTLAIHVSTRTKRGALAVPAGGSPGKGGLRAGVSLPQGWAGKADTSRQAFEEGSGCLRILQRRIGHLSVHDLAKLVQQLCVLTSALVTRLRWNPGSGIDACHDCIRRAAPGSGVSGSCRHCVPRRLGLAGRLRDCQWPTPGLDNIEGLLGKRSLGHKYGVIRAVGYNRVSKELDFTPEKLATGERLELPSGVEAVLLTPFAQTLDWSGGWTSWRNRTRVPSAAGIGAGVMRLYLERHGGNRVGAGGRARRLLSASLLAAMAGLAGILLTESRHRVSKSVLGGAHCRGSSTARRRCAETRGRDRVTAWGGGLGCWCCGESAWDGRGALNIGCRDCTMSATNHFRHPDMNLPEAPPGSPLNVRKGSLKPSIAWSAKLDGKSQRPCEPSGSCFMTGEPGLPPAISRGVFSKFLSSFPGVRDSMVAVVGRWMVLKPCQHAVNLAPKSLARAYPRRSKVQDTELGLLQLLMGME